MKGIPQLMGFRNGDELQIGFIKTFTLRQD